MANRFIGSFLSILFAYKLFSPKDEPDVLLLEYHDSLKVYERVTVVIEKDGKGDTVWSGKLGEPGSGRPPFSEASFLDR